uniref:DNA-(apurinic or apyrimidinic site) lyase n=1 Tax=Octactis speculum TaxID=3111310 RepID=A0A7S2GFY0_9STRA|mmetsp:Transcript_46272/g.62947  ORF Transcript_46272/g.62947 Transcript_46272/m.62947 type:complete len:413 (+) Transcript_46272:140-1378(+)
MVEGHSVHRVASRHKLKLVGKKFQASSPNGRFADGAAAITEKEFVSIEAVGKNLFAWFGKGDQEVCVHVHFGMAGNWAVFEEDEAEPATTPTTRLRLECSGVVAHLSAMTVAHGSREGLYLPKRSKLGEDPLRADADPERLWKKVSASKKSIGALVMDQSAFCGPGNIYRAEILFKAGVHPDRPGKSLTREEFDSVWSHTVDLLRRGYATGSILTVDDADQVKYGDLRRYIYNKAHCPKCLTRIVSWEIASRTAYACPSCQPMAADAVPQTESAVPSTPKKTKSNKDAVLSTPEPKSKKRGAEPTQSSSAKRQHVPFPSHCVRDSLADRLANPAKLTVKELKAVLRERGHPTDGLKAVLVARLAISLDGTPPPMRSAEDAAADKARAGENKAVEHIAELHPTQTTKARGRRL